MSHADQLHTAELLLGSSADQDVLGVRTYSDGSLLVTLATSHGRLGIDSTLGQAIQIRDFLNRHIDELALKQTGSLAERASDDPTQLAAEEAISAALNEGAKLLFDTGAPAAAAPPHKGCGITFRVGNEAVFVCGKDDARHYSIPLCPTCRGSQA